MTQTAPIQFATWLFAHVVRCHRRGALSNTTRSPRLKRHPITLIEVAIAAALSVLLIQTVISGLLSASQAAYAAGQHTTAMCLCEETLESMRAADFDDITEANFPSEENLSLTHTQAERKYTIPCTRTVVIQDESTADINARRVIVTVSWSFSGKTQDERIESILYDFF